MLLGASLGAALARSLSGALVSTPHPTGLLGWGPTVLTALVLVALAVLMIAIPAR